MIMQRYGMNHVEVWYDHAEVRYGDMEDTTLCHGKSMPCP